MNQSGARDRPKNGQTGGPGRGERETTGEPNPFSVPVRVICGHASTPPAPTPPIDV